MEYISELQSGIEKTLEHLKDEFGKVQTGRASATLVESVQVESYGAMQPLKGVASISIPDSQTISIQPWDKSMLAGIEKAIQQAKLGYNPVNDGTVVRIAIPPLSEERRRDLCKVVKNLAEEAKIAIRNLRQHAIKTMKAISSLSEDEKEAEEKKIQDKVDAANKDIEEHQKKKETDIMTI